MIQVPKTIARIGPMIGDTSMLATRITLEFSTRPAKIILRNCTRPEYDQYTHECQAGSHNKKTYIVKGKLCPNFNSKKVQACYAGICK